MLSGEKMGLKGRFKICYGLGVGESKVGCSRVKVHDGKRHVDQKTSEEYMYSARYNAASSATD